MTYIMKIYQKYVSIYSPETGARKLLGKLTINFLSPCRNYDLTLTSLRPHPEVVPP